MNKRVSIVVPVYNSHATLPKCLDSLISQTYQNIEIICVNDKSKDNSIDIIREYQQKDPRVVLIDHEENKNAGGARNSGIKAATGTYVCFVDNDDWLATDAIEILINESNDCIIDLVAPNWCQYYNEKLQIAHINLISGADKKENCQRTLINGCRILGCLIKKDLLVGNSLFFPEKTFFEDNAIGFCIPFCANEIKAVDKILYFYNVSNDSSSHYISIVKIRDRVKTTDLYMDNMRRLNLINNENRELINFRYLSLSFLTIMRLIEIGTKDAKKLLDIVYNKYANLLPNTYINQMLPDEEKILRRPYFYFYLYKFKSFLRTLCGSKSLI